MYFLDLSIEAWWAGSSGSRATIGLSLSSLPFSLRPPDLPLFWELPSKMLCPFSVAWWDLLILWDILMSTSSEGGLTGWALKYSTPALEIWYCLAKVGVSFLSWNSLSLSLTLSQVRTFFFSLHWSSWAYFYFFSFSMDLWISAFFLFSRASAIYFSSCSTVVIFLRNPTISSEVL